MRQEGRDRDSEQRKKRRDRNRVRESMIDKLDGKYGEWEKKRNREGEGERTER